MKRISRPLLPILIASAAISAGAFAQQEEESAESGARQPTLYTTTDEGATYLNREGEVLEVPQGEAAVIDERGMRRLTKTPEFMTWPCSTDAAMSRRFATYTIDELLEANPVQEIVRRYFEVPEVIEPIPSWKDGEYHGEFSMNDLIQWSSAEFWYIADDSRPIVTGRRPQIQLVSLYVGTNQVVLDSHTIEELSEIFGWDKIPVVFIFNDTNVVPVSYFGLNVSLEELRDAFTQRSIKVADVPMWYQGDHHLKATVDEFEKFFEIPALEDIGAERLKLMTDDIQADGFYRKPMFVTMFSDTGLMVVDNPARVRAAQSLGIDRLPTRVVFIEPDSHLARCGPGRPANAQSSVSGSTTPIGGATVPPGLPVLPPQPEPEVSDS